MSIEASIQAVLDELKPMIALDGGAIEFISFDEGVVKVRLQGACSSCALSIYTVKLGIEARLIEMIPEVTQVIALNE